jgi:rhodanese-related sulfurtransferase
VNDFEVNPTEAQQMIADGAVLLDVREPEELVAARVADAVHIPMADLPERYDDLPEDRTIVVLCHSGHRSAQATAFLIQQGLEARNLAGGIVAWAADGLPVETG